MDVEPNTDDEISVTRGVVQRTRMKLKALEKNIRRSNLQVCFARRFMRKIGADQLDSALQNKKEWSQNITSLTSRRSRIDTDCEIGITSIEIQ